MRSRCFDHAETAGSFIRLYGVVDDPIRQESTRPILHFARSFHTRGMVSITMVLPAILAALILFVNDSDAKPLKTVRAHRRQTDTTCYSGVYVIYARGTYEPQGASLSNVVANAIVAAIPDSAANQVVYPANTSAISAPAGVQNAREQITDYYNACPTSKLVLMGYSQGAAVIGNTIAPGDDTGISESIGQNGVS